MSAKDIVTCNVSGESQELHVCTEEDIDEWKQILLKFCFFHAPPDFFDLFAIARTIDPKHPCGIFITTLLVVA